jgi:hypothetical protein
MGAAQPPFEFFITSSQTSLESFELSRLNAVANLRKELRQVVDEWIEAEIQARMARWILERRRLEASDSQSPVPGLSKPAGPPKPAVKALSAQGDSAGVPSADSKITAVKRASASAQRCLTNGCNGSSRKPSARHRELPSCAAPDPSRPCNEPSQPEPPHKPETGPNTAAAVADLVSLEKAVHRGARVLQRDSEETGRDHGAESCSGAQQLCLSAFAAPLAPCLASTAPLPRGLCQHVPDLGNRSQLAFPAASAPESDQTHRDDARCVSLPESSPPQKQRPSFRALSLYRRRVAAVS